MKVSKSTLADLRKLRAMAEADDAPPSPAPAARRRKRKREAADRQTHPSGGKAQTRSSGTAADTDTPAVMPALDADDRALFDQAMRFVRPLPRHGSRARSVRRDPDTLLRNRRAHAQGTDKLKEPPAPHTRRRPTAPLDPDAHEFLQSGCGTDLLRGLRRSKWLPEALLDLHGSSEEEAHERLDRFVVSCTEHGIRCVRIIHGKGIGSRHGTPVLKSAVRIHLCRLLAVQAWVQCAEPDGGAGAVTVLLRTPHDTEQA